MKLDKLLQNTKVVSKHGDMNIHVKDICSDSRKVEPGFLFVAVAGICTDGHDYISKAIEQGATVVVYDKVMIEEYFQRVTYIQVENSAKALAEIAATWYGNPSSKLKLIGVTGTNGKTTIATLLYDTVRKLGYSAGLFSTVCNYVNDEAFPTSLTTLDTLSLNRLMRKMVDVGCEYAFMEVSSHAIH
ncbi:MAG TPA: Mur ligase family protein, partial [Dysgonamonadaceae bacterium]|nr:Mur ligase family protein [Dysgonamonadaceae bacterium]